MEQSSPVLGMQPFSPSEQSALLLPQLLGVLVEFILFGVILVLATRILADPNCSCRKRMVAAAVAALSLGQAGSDCSRACKVFALNYGDWDFVATPRLEDGLGAAFGAVQQAIAQSTLLWQIYRLAPVGLGIGGGAELEAFRRSWTNFWRSAWARRVLVLLAAVGILMSSASAMAANVFLIKRSGPLLQAPSNGLPKAWVISARVWAASAVWTGIFLTSVLAFELVRARQKTSKCARQTAARLSSRSRGDPRTADLPPPPAPTMRSTLAFLALLVPFSGLLVLVLQMSTLILLVLDLRHYGARFLGWSNFCTLLLPSVEGITTLLILGRPRDMGAGDSWHRMFRVGEATDREHARTSEKPIIDQTTTARKSLRPEVSSVTTVTGPSPSRTGSRTSLPFHSGAASSEQSRRAQDPPSTGSSLSGHAAAHPFSTAASPCPDDIPGFGPSNSPMPSSVSVSSSRTPPGRKSSSGSDMLGSDAGTAPNGSSSSSLGLGFWGVQLPSNVPPTFYGAGGRGLDVESLSTITEETRSVFTNGDSWGRRTTGGHTPRKGSLPNGSSSADRDSKGRQGSEDDAARHARRATQSSFIQMSSSDSRTVSRKSSTPFIKTSSSTPSSQPQDRTSGQAEPFVPPYSFIDIPEGHPLSPNPSPPAMPHSLEYDRDGEQGRGSGEHNGDDLGLPPILPPRLLSFILNEPSTSRTRLSPIPQVPPSPSSTSSSSSSVPPTSRGLTARALSSLPPVDPSFRLGLGQRHAPVVHKESYLSMRTTSSDGRSPVVGDEPLPYAVIWREKDRSASFSGVPDDEVERHSVRTGVSGKTGSSWGCKDRNGTTDSDADPEELAPPSRRS